MVPTEASLILAFVRGVAPAKWEKRWREAFPALPLVLMPLPLGGSDDEQPPSDSDEPVEPDISLVRYAPGTQPHRETVHGVRLYEEAVALVVPTDHEFASESAVTAEDLAYVSLLNHPDHVDAWPPSTALADTIYAPQTVKQAIELAATGAGGVLVPLPLARHLSRKDVAVIEVHGLDPTTIWAVWDIERDDPVIQNLIGILRGRTPASSRSHRESTTDQSQRRRARKRR